MILWLERVDKDGVIRDHGSRWIYLDTGQTVGDVMLAAERWAMRGSRYLAHVMIRDAFDKPQTMYLARGNDGDIPRYWYSEMYEYIDWTCPIILDSANQEASDS